MRSLEQRFTAAFEIVADYEGYIDSDRVGLHTEDTVGLQVESDSVGNYRRLTYRYYDQQEIKFPRQKCGIYCRVEMVDDRLSALTLDSFAEGKAIDTAYFYQPQENGKDPARAISLIEEALGRLLFKSEKVIQ